MGFIHEFNRGERLRFNSLFQALLEPIIQSNQPLCGLLLRFGAEAHPARDHSNMRRLPVPECDRSNRLGLQHGVPDIQPFQQHW